MQDGPIHSVERATMVVYNETPIYYKYRRCSMVLLTLLSTTRVVVYHSSLSFALAVL
jgi:hypothetical protein